MTNWNDFFARLNERYGKRKHPLEYRNLYQLMIMTILPARDSDKHIQVAPPFFDAYPRLSDLARAKPRDLHVERIVRRPGLGKGTPAKIEKALMGTLDPALWADAGMSLSFLGREICRLTHPKCPDCIFIDVCPCFQNRKT